MKHDKALAGESSRKRRKVAEVEAEEGDEALSPISADTARRDGSTERNTRREYSSELGDDSP
jgi:hypothetical protein